MSAEREEERERRTSTDCVAGAISRKMNAINKAGRPIIPLRSNDESFSSGRARKSTGGGDGKEEGKRKRDEEERGRVAFGQFVIKFKIPSAEEADERVTNGRDRNSPRVVHGFVT